MTCFEIASESVGWRVIHKTNICFLEIIHWPKKCLQVIFKENNLELNPSFMVCNNEISLKTKKGLPNKK